MYVRILSSFLLICSERFAVLSFSESNEDRLDAPVCIRIDFSNNRSEISYILLHILYYINTMQLRYIYFKYLFHQVVGRDFVDDVLSDFTG